ncbi:MAG: TonB-dependent receptor [Planctomycetota bacterium]
MLLPFPLLVPLALPPAAPQNGPPEEPAPTPPAQDAAAGDVEADSESGPAEISERRTAFNLDTLVITPTRTKQSILDVPYTVDYVPQERIDQVRNLPQALRDVPGVMVQETGPAQGSPYIRGFTGFRTLYLIDGVRLNNSVFREGPNQYSGTVDALSLQGIEVVKGPSSVLYGSDAIGGTVNVFTKNPRIWDRPIGGEVFARVASGANYVVSRAEAGGAIKGKTAWNVGGSYKSFGDIRAGSGDLPNTGYGEWAADAKVQHLINDQTTFTFLAQHLDQQDAPRTHRTVFSVPFAGTEPGNEFRRDLNQKRTLVYGKLDGTPEALGDWGYSSTLSYHRQQEERNRSRTNNRVDQQGFDVHSIGLQATGFRDTAVGRLTVGGEWYHDIVDSFLNRFGNQEPADDIQGPVADDSTYDLAGLYAQLAFDVHESTTLTAGARFNYAAANADSVRDPVTDEKISIDEDFNALLGSLRFESRLYKSPEATVALYGGISQGFRAPNLSDLTRFDSARSDEFEIPSPGLDPEDFISYELGVKHVTDKVSFQLAGFITDGDDIIQRFPTGNTNPDGDVEITKANVGESRIGGVEIGAAYRFLADWTAFGNFTWLDGQEDFIDGLGDPVRQVPPSRLMPITTLLGVRYEPVGSNFSVEGRWAHAEDADRLSPRDEGDDTRIPPGGTPGYDVFDLIGTYRFRDSLRLFLSLENITNEDYRIHGSGNNRPGRNLLFGVRVLF